ncbi:LysR substrate-binding domain-containing protein [Aeromonas dhakensis]|uniref:LysR substrate-binding domain-containing protein n=1 Tax=Aeromonas dhakensis TaxID=196024 RepID=UPI0007EC9035|nr:LysR substrate-binding domain-containing protein [Aeromonas dhakensis]OBR40796.1 transcriptional regulator [Aeromonas dhakensis]
MSHSHIDLNLFRIFDRVMTEKGVSAAAASLEMTPAAISQAIRRLSDLIGEPLFRRDGRGIIPTSRALALHREIRTALHTMERSLLLNQAFDPLTSQRIFRIASHPDLDLLLLPALLAHLARVAPHCRVESVPGMFEEHLRQQALRLRNIDLVLASTALEETGFCNESLLTLELRVACRADHPRIEESLDFETFFAEEHVVWDVRRKDDWVIRSLSDQALPPRKIAYESNALLTALSLVSQTEWLCVVSQWHVEQMRDTLRLKDFPLPWASSHCPVYISWHQAQGRDPPLQWFIRQLHLISAGVPLI